MLKEHQLFYYGKMHHTTAYGVMNLLSYSVAMGKTSDKKFHFEALPPDKHLRTFHFYCETAAERDRCSEKASLMIDTNNDYSCMQVGGCHAEMHWNSSVTVQIVIQFIVYYCCMPPIRDSFTLSVYTHHVFSSIFSTTLNFSVSNCMYLWHI